MNWLKMKITDPKRFKILDREWRKKNRLYLREYNTAYQRESRWFNKQFKKAIATLLGIRKLAVTLENCQKVFDDALGMASKTRMPYKGVVRARRKGTLKRRLRKAVKKEE